MELPDPSPEQQSIINAVCDFRKNVIVDAVAGSGKTTTVLYIARQLKVIQLTYNRALCDEVREKIEESCVNADVYTYHSFAKRLYYGKGKDDALLHYAIDSKEMPPWIRSEMDTYRADVLVIDEIQDASPLKLKFVRKYLHDAYITYGYRPPTIVALGDRHQCMYDFQDSDSRFLTMFDLLMCDMYPGTFERLQLNTSFRLTPKIAQYVNECVLGTDRIVGGNVRGGDACVSYIMGEMLSDDTGNPNHTRRRTKRIIWEYYRNIASIIGLLVRSDDTCDACKQITAEQWRRELLDKVNNDVRELGINESDIGRYDANDVFVLAPSVKQFTVIPLSTCLAQIGINAYHSADDERAGDANVTTNKVVFSTFHTAKGRERKVVFVLNFDSFLYKAFDWTKHACPDPIYVALTRASEKLFVCGEIRNKILPFMQIKDYGSLANHPVIHWNWTCGDIHLNAMAKDVRFSRKNSIDVTQFLRTMSEKAQIELRAMLDNIFVLERAADRVPVADQLPSTHLKEEVSDLNGMTIPALFESDVTGAASWTERAYDVLMEDLARELNEQRRINHNSDDATLFDPMNVKWNAFVMCHDIVQAHIKHHVTRARSNRQRVLAIASIVNAADTGCYPRLSQTSDYSWLDRFDIDRYINNLHTAIGNRHAQHEFEHSISILRTREGAITSFDFDDDAISEDTINTALTVTGRIDMITHDSDGCACIWELKCTSELEFTHKLQLAVYAYMYALHHNLSRIDAKLYNMITCETWRIKSDALPVLIDMMRCLFIDHTRQTLIMLDDCAFVERVRNDIGFDWSMFDVI